MTQRPIEGVVLAPEGTPLAVFQKERTNAISEMFDNVYANGIYPTSHFFARIDKCVEELLDEQRRQADERLREVVGEITAHHDDHAAAVDANTDYCRGVRFGLRFALESIKAKHNIDITPNTPQV